MHDRSTDHEVFVELVLQVGSEERFALERERALVLQFDIHVGTGLQDGGVKNSDRSHGVVDGVVDVLDEGRTASGDGDRAAGYVHRAQTNLAAVRTFVFSGEVEFVLLANLLSDYKCGVVQFLVAIFADQARVIAQRGSQVFAEGLEYREDDLTTGRVYGEAFQEVESSVRVGVVLRVQAVEVHHADELLALDGSFVEVLYVCSDRVVAVGDVQFELLLVDAGCSKCIDIFHHQVPSASVLLSGGVGTGFQHLKCQRVGRTQFLVTVCGELTDLEHLSVVGIFVGDSEHFVLVEGALEGDVTQRCIERIFAAGEQTCRFDLLEVRSAFHAVESFECRTGLLQVTEWGRANGGVEVVGVVIRRAVRCTAPTCVLGVTAVLTEVGESNDVTCLIVVTAFVGHPHFDLVNRHTGRYVRRAGH